jgi:hypothetical protein
METPNCRKPMKREANREYGARWAYWSFWVLKLTLDVVPRISNALITLMSGVHQSRVPWSPRSSDPGHSDNSKHALKSVTTSASVSGTDM